MVVVVCDIEVLLSGVALVVAIVVVWVVVAIVVMLVALAVVDTADFC